jgi:hypothetical protein
MFSVGALVGSCIDTFHKANLLTTSNNINVTKHYCRRTIYVLNDNSLLWLPSMILQQMSLKMPRKNGHYAHKMSEKN